MKIVSNIFTIVWLLSLAVSAHAEEFEADLCVFGGTSGGVVAAVQAARMGKRVVLVESGRHLGGMTSGGLSAVDIGDPRSVGGIAREYFTRLVAFLEFGFPVQKSTVMTARSVSEPEKLRSNLIVRPLASDQEWDAYTDIHLASDWGYENAGKQREFITGERDLLRAMADSGLGIRPLITVRKTFRFGWILPNSTGHALSRFSSDRPAHCRVRFVERR